MEPNPQTANAHRCNLNVSTNRHFYPPERRQQQKIIVINISKNIVFLFCSKIIRFHAPKCLDGIQRLSSPAGTHMLWLRALKPLKYSSSINERLGKWILRNEQIRKLFGDASVRTDYSCRVENARSGSWEASHAASGVSQEISHMPKVNPWKLQSAISIFFIFVFLFCFIIIYFLPELCLLNQAMAQCVSISHWFTSVLVLNLLSVHLVKVAGVKVKDAQLKCTCVELLDLSALWIFRSAMKRYRENYCFQMALFHTVWIIVQLKSCFICSSL